MLFDETTPMEIRNLALKSSASIPFVFPPVELDDFYLIDGSTFQNIALGDPIQRCMDEEGVEEKDIIVDIVLCLGKPFDMHTLSGEEMMWSNALDVYTRRVKITDFYIDYEDIIRVIRANPNVNYRYTVVPT